jgi:hypothetical protein
MSAVLTALAFAAAFGLGSRSLGAGLAVVAAVGYVSGAVRANFLGVFSAFMFDAAVLGLYLAFFLGPHAPPPAFWRSPVAARVTGLVAWPGLLAVLVPINDPLIQLVAFRAAVWFLPMVLVAGRLGDRDLVVLARALAGLNLLALAVGAYEYNNGIQAVFPRNAVTEIMYRSQDVAGGHHRIPATFINAHSYGGTMALSLPFLLGRLFDRRAGAVERAVMLAGVGAALGGVLLCAARQPVVMTVVTLLLMWALTGFSPKVGAGLGVLLAAGVYLALTDERFQRAGSLQDTKWVSGRVGNSANAGFFDLMLDYPLGAGMGSAVGTSIPFFLLDRAPKQIGLENEYCRIVVDQGWVGLGLWAAFLLFVYSQIPSVRAGPWGLGAVAMYATTATAWATALIGTGLLTSVPGSVLMLLSMGLVARGRDLPGGADAPPPPAGRAEGESLRYGWGPAPGSAL